MPSCIQRMIPATGIRTGVSGSTGIFGEAQDDGYGYVPKKFLIANITTLFIANNKLDLPLKVTSK